MLSRTILSFDGTFALVGIVTVEIEKKKNHDADQADGSSSDSK
ncbi:hypothetical protein [Bacillus cereus group sp. BY105LC]|nr:hypothetical protein [Bacillus cereus group sp. BY105LC]MDA1888150.1 hypothetical protein [Bacillus cereus group sp. BY105LC]MDA2628484.1 hypothetical protein [Bacillus cereus]